MSMCSNTAHCQHRPSSTANIANAHLLEGLCIHHKKQTAFNIMTLSFILVFPSPDFLRDLRSALAAIPYSDPITPHKYVCILNKSHDVGWTCMPFQLLGYELEGLSPQRPAPAFSVCTYVYTLAHLLDVPMDGSVNRNICSVFDRENEFPTNTST